MNARRGNLEILFTRQMKFLTLTFGRYSPFKIVCLVHPSVKNTSRRVLRATFQWNSQAEGFLKMAMYFHCIVHLVKGILEFQMLYENVFKQQKSISEWAILGILFNTLQGFGEYLFLNVILNNSQELCNVYNCILSLPQFGCHNVLDTRTAKIVLAQLPIFTCSVMLFYLPIVILQDIDPITIFLKIRLSSGENFKEYKPLYCTIRVITIIYDIWNFMVCTSIGAILVYAGAFISYVVIYKVSRNLFHNRFNFMDSIRDYTKLQLFTATVNRCFQSGLTFWFTIMAVVFTVVDGTICIDYRLREGLSIGIFMLLTYFLVAYYILFIYGYAFLGGANENSKRIKKMWSRMLVRWAMVALRTRENRIKLAIDRRVVRAKMDIRIGIGLVNFFEKLTSLVLVMIIVEWTANFLLVF